MSSDNNRLLDYKDREPFLGLVWVGVIFMVSLPAFGCDRSSDRQTSKGANQADRSEQREVDYRGQARRRCPDHAGAVK
jgi:hypothetical protein